MRRLIRMLAGRRANGERGAVLVLTAVLVAFVAIGMLALTIDLGNITYNRAQLQNGADASSLALATACANASATSTTPCDVTSDLTKLAVKNANVSTGGDQSMSVLAPPASTKTCINATGAAYVTKHDGTTDLPLCGDPTAESTSDLSSCQPWSMSYAPGSVSYVEVTTQTKMKDGSSVLPFHFAQILSGVGTGSTSNTCSRAAWGPAGSTGGTLPLTMGACDWENGSASGGDYAPAPPYSVDPNTGSAPPPEVLTPTNKVIGIFAHDSGDNLCSDQPNGGFSWLDPDSTADPDCTVTIGDGDNAPTNPGGDVPCKGVLASFLGKVVAVPIFDTTAGTGNNATYHIIGVAAFYLAGYDHVPSAKPDKTMSVYNEPSGVCTGTCNSSTTYVWGWFTTGLLPIDSTINPGGDDFGAEVVVPAG